MTKEFHKESGNALWVILLAVALMAALTATISRTSDTAEQSGNFERFRVHASNMMTHAAGVKEAVNRMRMTGIGENQISFSSALSGSCGECLVYGSAGGGASYEPPNPEWFDSTHNTEAGYGQWEFFGENDVAGVGTGGADLVMALGYIKENLCRQINVMLKVPGEPVDADGFDTTPFNGSFASSDVISGMAGAEAGCFEDQSGGRYFTFYQVLVKR